MCGIHGFSWSMYGKKSKENIKKMIAASHSRGPDGDGLYVDKNIVMGHNLLAITEEPSLSIQPIETDRSVLCYNGEIYNYKELKRKLERLGYSFEGGSDTEVLLKSIIEWGDECINNLDGMFAIAYYDKVKNTLLLCRDSSGTKRFTTTRVVP